MQKIVKLIVVLVVVFAAYSIGWPWLQGILNRSHVHFGGSASPEVNCLDVTESAVDYFAERVRQFISPPMGADAWVETVSKTRKAVKAARRSCGCEHKACREGRRALSELDAMVSDFDSTVQVRQGLPADGPRLIENLYTILKRARNLLP